VFGDGTFSTEGIVAVSDLAVKKKKIPESYGVADIKACCDLKKSVYTDVTKFSTRSSYLFYYRF
jgi:hypothetical protein